jgi:hypothetical protein
MNTAYEKIDFDNPETGHWVEPIEGPSAEFVELLENVKKKKKALKPNKNSWRSSDSRSPFDQHEYNESVKELWHFMQEHFGDK